MSQLTRITDDDFDIKVIVAGRPVVVFFTAKWSSPVKAGNQVLDELQTEYADKALFFDMDVDESPETAKKYGVNIVPTTLIFKRVPSSVVGSGDRQHFKNAIISAMG